MNRTPRDGKAVDVSVEKPTATERLRPRQQHGKIERVRETRLVDPFLLVHQDAMHHGDLPGRPAEIDAADLQPDLEGLAEARVHRIFNRHHARSGRLGRPVVALLGRKAHPGEQGIVDHETAFEQPMVVVAGERR